MKRFLLFVILLVFALCLDAQAITAPDSTTFTVIRQDSTMALKVSVHYSGEDGGSSVLTGVTEPMDSAGFAAYLQDMEQSGQIIGQLKIKGKSALAKSAQLFLIAEKNAADLSAVSDIYQEVTGIDLQDTKMGYDRLLVGDWLLVQTDPVKTTTEVEIFRKNSNNQLTIKDTTLQSKVIIESSDEISIARVGGLSKRVTLIRKAPNSKVFISIDGSIRMRPFKK